MCMTFAKDRSAREEEANRLVAGARRKNCRQVHRQLDRQLHLVVGVGREDLVRFHPAVLG